MNLRVWRNNQFIAWQPNWWDVVAVLLMFAIFVMLAWGAKQMAVPYHLGQRLPISLSPHTLPNYALRTILRMGIALFASLIFTFTIGTLAAKNKHAERIIIPLIDIAQSIPVLGFLSIAIVISIAMFPNSLMGPECAAILVIFTSQAWNMFLGFYQSLRTIPHDLREASAMFQLSAWQRFWRVEVPFALPSLIWNTMMSLSASWFFIVASEAITVNNQQILLPGIGSYIGVAILHRDKFAIVYAIIAMLIIIMLYDQLIFRPLIQWSEKFKAEDTHTAFQPKSLLMTLMQRTRLLHHVGIWMNIIGDYIVNCRWLRQEKTDRSALTLDKTRTTTVFVYLWYSTIALLSLAVLYILLRFIFKTVNLGEVPHVLLLGLFTSIKIIILLLLCAIVWVPVGVWIGMRPRVAFFAQPIAQFLAAFPANLLFPVVVMLIIHYHLNVEVWTTPLMILGTQWYILFNVIAGASALPNDLVQAAQNFGLKRWIWWKRFILPGIFPYVITGAITAAGGAWNASIIAEVVSWGHTTLRATGLGAFITEVTRIGDFPRVALGLGVMCLYVLIFNRLVWQPLYNLAEKRFQLD